MNIVYTLNDKFVPQVAAGICSVCENNLNASNINFYLISNEISDENKALLEEFVKSYKRKISIIELGDIKKYFDFEFDTTGWNSIVLARLVVDKLLPKDIKRILYLDGDTIVRGSLEELWNQELGENILAASIEPTVDKIRKKNLGLEKYSYFNAGVLLIDLEKCRNINAGKIILDYYYKEGVEYVFYDTLKNDIQHIGDGEEIKKTATVLSNIAQKYKMFIGSTLQLLESTTAPINLTINDMAASRTVKEVLDTLCLFKQINNQSYADYEYSEIEESKQYKDIKAYEDPDVRYYACVVDKNRAGAKPKLLFKLNLAYNEWFELGHLRMKQKLK